MWFRKKIKETPKRGMYGNKHNTSNYSVWDGMSSIEKLCMVGLPIGLTFIDYMMIDGMFGFVWWLSASVSVISTIVLYTLMWWFITWMSERD